MNYYYNNVIDDEIGEQAKIQAPDGFAKDFFGNSIAMDNTLLAVGSPGQDGLLKDAGAAYLYKLKFASVSFSAVLSCLEFRFL